MDEDIIEDGEYSDPKSAIKFIDKQILQINREMQMLVRRKTSLEQRKTKLLEAAQQQQSAELAKQDWESTDHSWSTELHRRLRDDFNISCLRPQQLPTMNATLSGTDCILIMPTGGGKSLCYQLPALLSKGVTLVVSPLLSLIEDQVLGLQRRGIQAAMLSASSTKQEVNAVHTGLTDPKWPCKLLYVTPERLAKSKRLMAKLQKTHQVGRLCRVAIDEVHCCSQWGHDFRPDYKFLGILRKTFLGVPLLGLTATATARVVTDVQSILDIRGCLVLKASFNRPNLYYEVREKPSSQAECVQELARLLTGQYRGQSGIIYTTTIKETLSLVTELRKMGVKVGPYHGQLEADVRSKVHQRWLSGEYQAVVATIAFGMGIDKPDVRFVIHHSVSKSVENYYQESGRAGRDGRPADCVLYWRYGDLFKQSTMVFTEQTGIEKLYSMLAYCIDAAKCRRNLLSEHFGERWEESDCSSGCDHCRASCTFRELDLTKHLTHISSIIRHAAGAEQRLTGQKLVDAWQGRGGAPGLRVKEAINSSLSRTQAETVVVQLLLDGCLREDFHFTPYSTISYIVLGPKAEAGLCPSPLLIAEDKNGTVSGSGASDRPAAAAKPFNKRKTDHNKVNESSKKKKSTNSDGDLSDDAITIEGWESPPKEIEENSVVLKALEKQSKIKSRNSAEDSENFKMDYKLHTKTNKDVNSRKTSIQNSASSSSCSVSNHELKGHDSSAKSSGESNKDTTNTESIKKQYSFKSTAAVNGARKEGNKRQRIVVLDSSSDEEL